MKTPLRLLAAALVAGLPAVARAQCAAPGAAFDLSTNYFAFARVGSAVYNFSCLITPSGDGTFGLAFGSNAAAIASYTSGASTAFAFLSSYSVTFDPTGVADGAAPGTPNITWSVSTRTALRPDGAVEPTFDLAFAFGMPVEARRYESASASQGFSLTNANARTSEGVSLTPAGVFAALSPAPAGFPVALFGAGGPLSAQPMYAQVLTGGVNATGIGAGATACTLPDPNGAGRTRQQVCGFDSGVQPLDATVSSVGLLVQYRQHGVLSVVTNGTMLVTPAPSISAVPEPATLALTATGLLVVAGGAITRRRGAAALG